MNTSLQSLLEELDTVSDAIDEAGHNWNDPEESPVFFKFSNQLDDLIEKYSQLDDAVPPSTNEALEGELFSVPDGC